VINPFACILVCTCNCQVALAKRQRSDLCGLPSPASSCYYQCNHSKVEAVPLSALPKDTTSELVGLSSHYPFFMLNVKKGSCKYQLLKLLGQTRPGNRAQVYRLQGERFNH